MMCHVMNCNVKQESWFLRKMLIYRASIEGKNDLDKTWQEDRECVQKVCASRKFCLVYANQFTRSLVKTNQIAEQQNSYQHFISKSNNHNCNSKIYVHTAFDRLSII